MTGSPPPTEATVSVAVQGTTVATVEGDLTLGWASELISYFDVCSVAQAEQASLNRNVFIWDFAVLAGSVSCARRSSSVVVRCLGFSWQG